MDIKAIVTFASNNLMKVVGLLVTTIPRIGQAFEEQVTEKKDGSNRSPMGAFEFRTATLTRIFGCTTSWISILKQLIID